MAGRPLRMPRAIAPMRLRRVPSAPPPPPRPAGELEPELVALIRALAEADAEADCRAALQRRGAETKTIEITRTRD